MELSTLIILAIATLIIAYRIKTWNDVQVDDTHVNEAPIKEDSSKAKATVQAKTKTVKKAKETINSAKDSAVLYKKKYNASVSKNKLLVESVLHPDITGTVMEFKGEPKKGVTTKIVLINDLDGRAQGIILEARKDQLILIKSFDVKMGTAGQFKVPTSFSKAQTLKVDELKEQNFKITHFLGHDEVVYELKNISLELQ
ncbi:MAG: hypothetical protein OEW60_04315 [Thiovulaceae bacterium]|nr:hypothetical protein [Sulfurimonadaceae bacterium]